jgi:aspartate 1-decarboxylase
MILTMMKAKLHRASVTRCDINYEGSISIDAELLAAAGILPNEQVDVLNLMNGERFTTYAIAAPEGSGTIGINGAAARLCQVGDLVIVIAFAQMSEAEAKAHIPKVLQLGVANRVAV